MMMGKHDYSFRNNDFLDYRRLTPTGNAATPADCYIDDSWEIVVPASDSRLVKYFSYDLYRFFSECFGVCLRVVKTENIAGYLKNPEKKIILAQEDALDAPIVQSEMAAAFHITVTKASVVIIGKTERGTAQGAYYIEDMMRLRGQCALIAEKQEHAPLFSPRMTHSGTELDTFPDNFLEACAHAGMDAIIVFAGHPDTNLHGFKDPNGAWEDDGWNYCDFNNLVWRAEGYGLDVYIYNYMTCEKHPDDPGAEEHYDATFGQLFKNCPKLKGIVFVGESFEFPSKAPHTCGDVASRAMLKPKGEKRPSAGFYPCSDYPQFVGKVRDAIRKYSPDADIVFWTYNFGGAPEQERLNLVRNLPTDISMMITYDMWQDFVDENGEPYHIADYSISFVGPSTIFTSEAQIAKERGIRLYGMGNTGCRTWDNGITPYLPVPQQWQKRFEAMAQSKEDFGLCGLMENHHYGWMPSFLTLFTKNAFMTNGIPNDDMLGAIAVRDYGEKADQALQAWDLFSKGIRRVVAASVDQYGPYRCGPTYPLLFDQKKEDLDIPHVAWAWHHAGEEGNIWWEVYRDDIWRNPKASLLRLSRLNEVVKYYEEGSALLDRTVKELGAAYGSEISKQAANARFLKCSFVTCRHVLKWTIAKQLLIALKNGEDHGCVDALYEAIGVKERTVAALYDYMVQIAKAEDENTDIGLTCWREDSVIGFECSLEYAFNDLTAQWKKNETQKSLEKIRDYIGK